MKITKVHVIPGGMAVKEEKKKVFLSSQTKAQNSVIKSQSASAVLQQQYTHAEITMCMLNKGAGKDIKINVECYGRRTKALTREKYSEMRW